MSQALGHVPLEGLEEYCKAKAHVAERNQGIKDILDLPSQASLFVRMIGKQQPWNKSTQGPEGPEDRHHPKSCRGEMEAQRGHTTCTTWLSKAQIFSQGLPGTAYVSSCLSNTRPSSLAWQTGPPCPCSPTPASLPIPSSSSGPAGLSLFLDYAMSSVLFPLAGVTFLLQTNSQPISLAH